MKRDVTLELLLVGALLGGCAPKDETTYMHETSSESSKPNGPAQASTPESRCGAYNQECIARETHREAARRYMEH
jgi:hypothetical protein